MRYRHAASTTEHTVRVELLDDPGPRRHGGDYYWPKFAAVTYRRINAVRWDLHLVVLDGPRERGGTTLELFDPNDPKPGWLMEIIATEKPTL